MRNEILFMTIVVLIPEKNIKSGQKCQDFEKKMKKQTIEIDIDDIKENN